MFLHHIFILDTGVTIGLATVGLIFGIILFKLLKDAEDGVADAKNKDAAKAKGDFVY